MYRPGTRLACPACTVEVILVRPSRDETTLSCAGARLVLFGEPRSGDGHPDVEASVAIGKRYVHKGSGLEVLCTKPGDGVLECDGTPLEQLAAKPLPASD